jgi:SecD/SecF fusion protein
VDANVVIFERIREEILTGRTLRSALNAGFKRAFPAIVDCNITTLIAAGVLFWQGTGPIQGFAITLAIGIVVSMFSALVLTKWMLISLVDMGLKNPKHYGVGHVPVKTEENEALHTARVWNIVKWRRYYMAGSVAVMAVAVGLSLFHHFRGDGLFNMDVEFSGGTSFQITMGQPFENDALRAIVTEVTGQTSPQVNRAEDTITGEISAMLKMHSLDTETRNRLINRIAAEYGLSVETDFSYADVDPTVSADMQRSAIIAVGLASILMMVYITLRFKDLRMGASTVLTLLHDALLTVAVYAILRIPLSYAFIAVLLTIMGYTIVIFDRIRENKAKTRAGQNFDLRQGVDISITQNLRRAVLTSGTTLLAVLCLYGFGVSAIKDFTLPIIIGLFFGTYSSVFLSGPLWYMMNSVGRKKA